MVGGVEKVVNICSFETLKNLETNKGDKEREDHPSPYTKSAYFRIGDWENYLNQIWPACMDVDMLIRAEALSLNPPSLKNYRA